MKGSGVSATKTKVAKMYHEQRDRIKSLNNLKQLSGVDRAHLIFDKERPVIGAQEYDKHFVDWLTLTEWKTTFEMMRPTQQKSRGGKRGRHPYTLRCQI